MKRYAVTRRSRSVAARLEKLSRCGALLVVGVIGVYAILVGGSASVVRAASMGGITLTWFDIYGFCSA